MRSFSHIFIYVLFFTFSISTLSTVRAEGRMSEEDGCFSLLSKTVQEVYGLDLSEVKKSEESEKTMDLSTYGNFLKNRIWKGADPYFWAKRNNIGTIISNEIYILTQFSSFGNTTAFDFPIKEPGINMTLGEKYPDFRDNIVYIHHLPINGEFVSCGYLKIVPAAGKDYEDLGQENYMTNVLPGSGFEIYDTPTFDEKEYLIGKVQVAANNYNNEPLFTIHLITVAYNNGSNYFNEYETFPLQVKAMTDPDEYKTVDSVQKRFLDYVYNETCLQLPHPNRNSLPPQCQGEYRSLAKKEGNAHTFTAWLGNLVPNAYARLPEEARMKDLPVASGMLMNSSTPYELKNKLEQIGDPELERYVLNALSPEYEDYIQNLLTASGKLNEYETVFVGCGLDFPTRTRLIQEWMNGVDPKVFSKNTIEYPDVKIGDCLIPYPDRRHLAEVIPGSFPSNQAYAKKLQNSLQNATGSQVSPQQSELISRRVALEEQYQKELAFLEERLRESGNSGAILTKIETLRNTMNTRIDEVDRELTAVNRNESEVLSISRMIQIGLGLILLFLAGSLAYILLIRNRNTPKQ